MRAVRIIEGLAAPLMLADVDTDVITPMRRIMRVRREELGRYAFEPLRFMPADPDQPDAPLRENPAFVLNQLPWRNARVLLAGANFGCGSSRETAVWALQQLGIEAVVAPSFGDIFFNNCLQSGLLPIVLPRADVEACAVLARRAPTAEQSFRVDLEAQTIVVPDGTRLAFAIDGYRKQALLRGLDDIGMTLAHIAEIDTFERAYATRRPFLLPRS